jgi:hypothetical protein
MPGFSPGEFTALYTFFNTVLLISSMLLNSLRIGAVKYGAQYNGCR